MVRRRRKYLTRADLLGEIQLAKQKKADHPHLSDPECLSNQFCNYFMLLVDNFSKKPNFCGYSWLEDMKGDALIALVRGALKFDETRSEIPNPFAYYTQIVKYSFLNYLDKESKQREVKDNLRMHYEMIPSYAAQMKQGEDFLAEIEQRTVAANNEKAPVPTRGRPRKAK